MWGVSADAGSVSGLGVQSIAGHAGICSCNSTHKDVGSVFWRRERQKTRHSVHPWTCRNLLLQFRHSVHPWTSKGPRLRGGRDLLGACRPWLPSLAGSLALRPAGRFPGPDWKGPVRGAHARRFFRGSCFSAPPTHSACIEQVMHMFTNNDSGFRATDYARGRDPRTPAMRTGAHSPGRAARTRKKRPAWALHGTVDAESTGRAAAAVLRRHRLLANRIR